ncbi:hypothetical protein H0H93_007709 [Arthromyces matolae]|nr:hypothetical protein H0H93_007709 [Arthromyces matolae]
MANPDRTSGTSFNIAVEILENDLAMPCSETDPDGPLNESKRDMSADKSNDTKPHFNVPNSRIADVDLVTENGATVKKETDEDGETLSPQVASDKVSMLQCDTSAESISSNYSSFAGAYATPEDNDLNTISLGSTSCNDDSSMVPRSSSPLPPSSSPSQLFSSSPSPSSQSSIASETLYLGAAEPRDRSQTLGTLLDDFQCAPDRGELVSDGDDIPIEVSLEHNDGESKILNVENIQMDKSPSIIVMTPLSSHNADVALTCHNACSVNPDHDTNGAQNTPLHDTLSIQFTVPALEDPRTDAVHSETGSQKFFVSDNSALLNEYDRKEFKFRPLMHVELPLFDLEHKNLPSKRKDEDESRNEVTPVQKKYKPSAMVTMASLPNPRRSTIASQKSQHEKLISPFRSPLRSKLSGSTSPIETASVTDPLPATPTKAGALSGDTLDINKLEMNRKHRTQRASAPFKSPLSADVTAKLPSVRLTPTLQALERKVQLLKRAVKIKEDGDEEVLLQLIKQWTEAGQELASEVWELVKDNGSRENQCGHDSYSKTKQFENSWGGQACSQQGERNWGWDVEAETTVQEISEPVADNDDVDYEKPQDTLRTMLMQLGINPETLGWDEDSGEFRAYEG